MEGKGRRGEQMTDGREEPARPLHTDHQLPHGRSWPGGGRSLTFPALSLPSDPKRKKGEVRPYQIRGAEQRGAGSPPAWDPLILAQVPVPFLTQFPWFQPWFQPNFPGSRLAPSGAQHRTGGGAALSTVECDPRNKLEINISP